MVLAEDLAAAGEGVLVKLAGALVITEAEQVAGEVVGGIEGVGMVLAETVAPGLVQALSKVLCGVVVASQIQDQGGVAGQLAEIAVARWWRGRGGSGAAGSPPKRARLRGRP